MTGWNPTECYRLVAPGVIRRLRYAPDKKLVKPPKPTKPTRAQVVKNLNIQLDYNIRLIAIIQGIYFEAERNEHKDICEKILEHFPDIETYTPTPRRNRGKSFTFPWVLPTELKLSNPTEIDMAIITPTRSGVQPPNTGQSPRVIQGGGTIFERELVAQREIELARQRADEEKRIERELEREREAATRRRGRVIESAFTDFEGGSGSTVRDDIALFKDFQKNNPGVRLN